MPTEWEFEQIKKTERIKKRKIRENEKEMKKDKLKQEKL